MKNINFEIGANVKVKTPSGVVDGKITSSENTTKQLQVNFKTKELYPTTYNLMFNQKTGLLYNTRTNSNYYIL